MRCAFCNEHISEVELRFNEAIELEDEYWHAECYEEYFGEVLEVA